MPVWSFIKNNLPAFGEWSLRIGTATAGTDIANGDYVKAIEKGVLGFSAMNWAAGSSQARDALIHSTIIGTATNTVICGIGNAIHAAFDKPERNSLLQRAKNSFTNGGGRAIAAIGVLGGSALLGAQKTAIIGQALALGSLSAVCAKSGIKDLKDGKYLKGVGKFALGSLGVATSIFGAYTALTQSEFTQMPGWDGPTEERRVKIATIYNNSGDPERDKISNYVVKTHEDYARKWGLEYDHISDANATAGQCTHPSTGESVNCTPYFEKIKYLKDQCQTSDSQGKIIYYIDDDMPITNKNIHPFHAWDQLRTDHFGNQHPTQIIVAKEEGDWPSLFPIPGYKGRHHPITSVNTGFIGLKVEKDGTGCQFIEKVWKNRNVDAGLNSDKCPMIGFCQTHGVLGSPLDDQAAWALAMQKEIERDPKYFFEKTMTVVDQRDESNPFRFHIAVNTLHRDGCRQDPGGSPYDISDHDRNYPNGMWRSGDWMGQPAGFQIMGKYPLPRVNGKCVDDPNVPITNTRLAKILEMKPEPEYEFTVLMTYTDPPTLTEADTYSHISEENAKTLAQVNRASFKVDKEPMHLMSSHPHTGKMMKVVPYWRKVKAAYDFTHQSEMPEKKRMIIIPDNDGLFNPNLDLYHFIKTMRRGNEAPFLVSDDIPQLSKTNTGLLLIEQTPETKQFTKLWLDSRDMKSYTPSDPDCPTHALCKDQRGGLHEQTVLDHLLRKKPELENSVVRVMPFREEGRAFGGINTFYRSGCMYDTTLPKQPSGEPHVAHYTFDYEFQPERAAKPGDAWIQFAGVPKKGRFCHEDSSIVRPIRKEYLQHVREHLVEKLRFKPLFKLW